MHITLFRRPRLAAVLGLATLAASAASAEPAPSFAELLGQAQTRAPRLAEARADIAKAQGLAQQAGTIPNPVVALDVENFSGSGPYDGANLSETTISAEQVIELGGKRSARVSAARAEIEAARRRATRTQSEFAFDLANAYAAAEAADRRLTLANEALSLAEEDGRVAGALVDAGREPDLRRVQADAATQAARATVEEARAARAVAFNTLTALAGAPAPITSIQQSLLDQSRPIFMAGAPPAGSTTAYAAAQAEQDAAQRRLRLERTRAVPDLSVSVGFRRFNEDDSTALIAGIAVPLPLFDRNRGNINAARADVDAARARAETARLEAEALVASINARLGAADTRLTASRAGEQAAEEAYRLTRIGYEAGRIGLIELINARRALTDARAQSIAAGVERVSAQAALARLNGGAVQGDPS